MNRGDRARAGWVVSWASIVLPAIMPGTPVQGQTVTSATVEQPGSSLDQAESLQSCVAEAIRRAGQTDDEGTSALLPADARLDAAFLDAKNVGTLRLTLPADSTFGPITQAHAQALDALMAAAFGSHSDLAGMTIEIRMGAGEYRPLNDYLYQSEPLPADPSDGITAKPATKQQMIEAFGGPSANADGQPIGALTGVVVYCSAGHGWTAGSSSWYLQRPLLLSMNEDYGNLDQLNYFVNYLYNAGAVVVPFRPVGYQSIEIVLDNDDPGVVFSGVWTNDSSSTYYYENGAASSGVRFRRTASNAVETATVRYTPNIIHRGFYPVYAWTTDLSDGVPQLYRIRHSGGEANVVIDHGRVGRGWIWLGNYFFEPGTDGHVLISNQSSVSGTVAADAIRFGNGVGDLIGAGPGTISGFPREEEASRYWAESEAGINAGGLSSSIWNCCTEDGDDNVGTAARWARQMNRIGGSTERWRRIYMEFHTNASSGGAKGTVALCNLAPYNTLNQLDYATLMGEKIEADMLALDDLFEFPWGSRNPNTYHASFAYGAINSSANGDEFDATILECAFHDNAEDAANLRNAAVRDALARSTVQGIITFLSNAGRFPGTQVPPIFAPDPPEQIRATRNGSGDIYVSWVAGPSRSQRSASGDAATSYKIYRSTNGYGFGNAVDVGDVLSATLTDLPAEQTVYLRVVACNAGGESMPSATMAVRRSALAASRVLIVDGFDRVSRQQNYVQNIPPGAMERQIARRVNSFDYAVQHAAALAESGFFFDYASNEAVAGGAVRLQDYGAAVWILGRESSADKTFDSTEQSLVTAYLNSGGNLFVSGSEIGYELDGLAAGRSFYEDTLRADFVADAAGSYNVVGVPEGVFADVAPFDFSPANGAPYVVDSPDHIQPRPGAITALEYATGSPKPAAIQFNSGVYRVIMLGFPFEVITSDASRTALMSRAMDYLLPSGCPNGPDVLSDFEGYAAGTQVMFQSPRYSGTTSAHLLASPDLATVTDEVPGYNGSRSCKVQWQWVDTDPTRWLRLTTNIAANVANPIIDLRQVVRVRLRLDSGSFRLALGVRETGVDEPIGSNGGRIGPIEWIGASSQIPGGGPQGVLVTAQPGVWQTVTFAAHAGAAIGFTGNGLLEPANGKVVLEHLAFAVSGTAGPITVYLDSIEQPCPLRMDFDADGDVDQADYGLFQTCLSVSGIAPTDPACFSASLDGDIDVDTADMMLFQGCFSGPGITADPACVE